MPVLAHTTAAFTWWAVLHIVLSAPNAQLCAVQGVAIANMHCLRMVAKVVVVCGYGCAAAAMVLLDDDFTA